MSMVLGLVLGAIFGLLMGTFAGFVIAPTIVNEMNEMAEDGCEFCEYMKESGECPAGGIVNLGWKILIIAHVLGALMGLIIFTILDSFLYFRNN